MTIFSLSLYENSWTQNLLELYKHIHTKTNLETLHAHLFTVLKPIQNSSLIFHEQNYSYELIFYALSLNLYK
jgi:hypothetical protein